MSLSSCDSSGSVAIWTDDTDLRIAPIFTIWAIGTLGAAFPILAYRSPARVTRIQRTTFEFTKYVGSGVVITTVLIHLLPPAISKLTSPCLGAAWKSQPYPLMLTFLTFFTVCVLGVLSFHIGTAGLMRLGINYDPHGYRTGAFIAHRQDAGSAPALTSNSDSKLEQTEMGKYDAGHTLSHMDGSKQASRTSDKNPMAQVLGVAIVELGIVLNSVLIGLTLAIDDRFKVFFVAAMLYQMFDGLALGSRLACLDLPHQYRNIPLVGVFLYGITTPTGIIMGLGLRKRCNFGSVHMSFLSGVLDFLSASILMYTGFVELLAQEFLFAPEIRETNMWKLLYALTCMALGCSATVLLGKWT